jgi:hypothetical protein
MATRKKKSDEGAQISGDDVAKTVVETVGKKMRTKMRTPAVKAFLTHRHHRYSIQFKLSFFDRSYVYFSFGDTEQKPK